MSPAQEVGHDAVGLEAWPGAYVQDVNNWMLFFLLVAWEYRNQSKPKLSGAFYPSSQAAPVVGERSLARQPPWLFEAPPARRACRYGNRYGAISDFHWALQLAWASSCLGSRRTHPNEPNDSPCGNGLTRVTAQKA
jgi:hypothetical protein